MQALNKKKALLLCAVAFFILIFIVISNTYTNDIFGCLLATFCNTAEKDILFIPLGYFIICTSFDHRYAYIVRFKNKYEWFKNEFVFITVVLFCYTMLYIGIGAASGIFAGVFIKHSVQINSESIILLLLVFIRRFAFLMLSVCIMLLTYLIFKKSIHTVGVLVYLVIETWQLIEEVAFSMNIIRPAIDLHISLWSNILYSISEISLTIFAILLVSLYTNRNFTDHCIKSTSQRTV